jgi:hypothetical protein
MATVNYLVRVTGELSANYLYAIGQEKCLLFKRKKDALNCYKHLHEQLMAMYNSEAIADEAIRFDTLEVYDGPMYLNFRPREQAPEPPPVPDD